MCASENNWSRESTLHRCSWAMADWQKLSFTLFWRVFVVLLSFSRSQELLWDAAITAGWMKTWQGTGWSTCEERWTYEGRKGVGGGGGMLVGGKGGKCLVHVFDCIQLPHYEHLQPADISWNKPFKEASCSLYDHWTAGDIHPLPASSLIYSRWKAPEIHVLVVRESFQVTGIALNPNGSEDE